MEVPLGIKIIDAFGANPISTKRDYASLKLIRDGYYFADEGGIYNVSFPENGPIARWYTDGVV
jgi:hypothetical protein